MLEEGDRILAGISGGADSLCLLALLWETCREREIFLMALHVHHGLRGEAADGDEAFVRDFCREREIPFRSVHVDMKKTAEERGLSEEEAGRLLRYEAFDAVMAKEGCTKLFLAHQADDLAETMLFNMTRGSGLAGLCSLRPVRGKICRPLLYLSRAEIEAHLESKGMTFRHDETNDSDRYSRNLIRHRLIPVLKEMNPGFLDHMAALSSDSFEMTSYLAEEKDLCRKLYTERRGEDIFIREELFSENKIASPTHFLIGLMGEAAGKQQDISRVHAHALSSLASGETGKRLDLPHGLLARRVRGGILLGKRPAETEDQPETKGLPLPLSIPGSVTFGSWTITCRLISEKPSQIPKKTWSKWFDYDRMSDGIVLRTRQRGDHLIIHPSGKRKSLSDHLTDIKYPAEERDRLPLIACGAEILWIPGDRTGEGRRVTDQTEHILEIRIEGAENECKDQCHDI